MCAISGCLFSTLHQPTAKRINSDISDEHILEKLTYCLSDFKSWVPHRPSLVLRPRPRLGTLTLGQRHGPPPDNNKQTTGHVVDSCASLQNHARRLGKENVGLGS